MQFDIKFDFAEVFSVNKVNVALGQKFKVSIVGSQARGEWFSNNDPVLFISVAEDGFSALVESKAVGRSLVQIQLKTEWQMPPLRSTCMITYRWT
jgi:hypothetical protein